MDIKFKTIKNKNLAITLAYMTGQDFFTYDNRYDDTKKVYSFENTPKFQQAYTLVMDFKKTI